MAAAFGDKCCLSDPYTDFLTLVHPPFPHFVFTEQFTADETSLLDTVFGSNWQQFGDKQQLDMAQFWKLSSLEADDFAKLGGLMDKLTAMDRYGDI